MTVADWGEFAEQWRDSYRVFTRGLAADPNLPWKTVDQHHLESLQELLATWQLAGLWTDEQVRDMSLIWHHLDPWSDSARGIALLNTVCCTTPMVDRVLRSLWLLSPCSDLYVVQRQHLLAV